ncbi:MAG: cell wall-binding repeat-containing protein [Coriobacteriia bacterium]|nr:cell wall-binding repeat-containing protein [Coriobacteriia bacterium]
MLATLLVLVLPATPAYADEGDTLPGYALSETAAIGHFDAAEYPTDVRDFYQVYLYAGETLEAALWWDPWAAAPLRLFGPAAVDPAIDPFLAISSVSDTYSPGYFAHVLRYTAPADGVYSLEVPRPATDMRYDYELHWSADDGDDDDIPGATLGAPLQSGAYSSLLNWLVDTDDVLPLTLEAGDTVTLTLAHEMPGSGDDFDLFLCAPGAKSVLDEGYVAWSLTEGTSAETLTYTAGVSGTYYVDVYAYDGSGPYTLDTTVVPSSIAVTEVAGADRIATAIAASKQAFPDHASTVVIATAFNWPDALGGSALAGVLDAPILLTPPTQLSPAVAAEIVRLGATRVVVLGGTGAVSPTVVTALARVPGVQSVQRIAGADRYATARAIADETIRLLGSSYDGGAFIATGAGFPDALGASPLAASLGWPIYLAHPDPANATALAATLSADGASNVFILGGGGAVSDAYQAALGAMFADRISGSTRYSTAVAVAEHGVQLAGLEWDGLAITTGQDFPDALAGGAMQGRLGSVLLLSPPGALDPVVADALLTHRADVSSVRFLGGTGALSITARSQALQALQ